MNTQRLSEKPIKAKPIVWPLEWCGVCKRDVQRRNGSVRCFWCDTPYGTSPTREEIEAAQ